MHPLAEVDAAEGIHDDRDARQAGRHLPQQFGLGGVGVDDGETLAPHNPAEMPERLQIGEWCHVACHRHCDVADASALNDRHFRPW